VKVFRYFRTETTMCSYRASILVACSSNFVNQ